MDSHFVSTRSSAKWLGFGLACSAGAILAAFGAASGNLRLEHSASTTQEAFGPAHPPTHRIPTVDGADHPELIPDEVARSLFFGMLSDTQDPEGRERAAAYVRYVIFARRSASDQSSRPATDDEVDGLLAAVEEYRPLVAQADTQMAATTDTGEFSTLKQTRDRVMLDFFASLPGRMGHDGSVRVDDYVYKHFKSKVRFFD